MTGPPLVHVVICTRNNVGIIGEALAALNAQGVPFTCSVVDGRSTDGTPAWVRGHYPWADVIVKDVDSGPSASRNIGAARASTPFLVFQDSDVQLAPDWLRIQTALMTARPELGAACGRLVYTDRPSVLQSAYGAMNRLGIAWDAGNGDTLEEHDTARPCVWGISAALIVRREAFVRVGGFDQALFAYHEDSDLGWRLNLAGYPVLFNPAAVGHHRTHSTMNAGTMNRRVTYLLHRNRLRSILVNYQVGSLAQYLPAYLALSALEAIARGPRGPKLKALAANVGLLPDTLRRRRTVQRARRVPDAALWPMFERGVRGPGRDVF